MKGNRDYSMLYGVLAGFALFVLFVGWLIAHTDWDSHVGSPVDYLFPEGTQIIEERDSHGGFHGDCVAFCVVGHHHLFACRVAECEIEFGSLSGINIEQNLA